MGFFSINNLLLLGTFAYIFYTGSHFFRLFFPISCSDQANDIQQCLLPAFPAEQIFTVEIYGQAWHQTPQFVFSHKAFKLHESFEKTFSVNLPVQVVKNGSFYLNVYLFPTSSSVQGKDTVQKSTEITAYRMPDQYINLLDSDEEHAKDRAPVVKVHWRNALTINFMEPFRFLRTNIPAEISHLLKLNSPGTYLPVMYLNTMKFKDSELQVINDTDRKALLTLRFEPSSVGMTSLWTVLELSMQTLSTLGFSEEDVSEVKQIFNDTNFFLLIITVIVAVFHMLFDFLSFKNDISFWRNTTQHIGISSRSVMWRCVSNVIILLYLAEEKSSRLVTIPAAISLVIELWKLSRVFKVSISFSNGFSFGDMSDEERQTNLLDSQGTKYLSYVLIPLCIGAPIYSLLYLPQKGWYSWTVHSLANCVYAFGFLFMTPQLFINYKLKSVAHLPWKALTYKAFNTFIDDLFAFIIYMPTAHRLACFRDDIIFIIYLYQRWLYPVDKTRVNEFGQSFDKKEKKNK